MDDKGWCSSSVGKFYKVLSKEQELTVNQLTDASGNPTGGSVKGVGINIDWQDGPLGRDDNRKKQNGAFVEDVITLAIDRLEFFQQSKFKCSENQRAIDSLKAAMTALDDRTKGREERGVEGTHVE